MDVDAASPWAGRAAGLRGTRRADGCREVDGAAGGEEQLYLLGTGEQAPLPVQLKGRLGEAVAIAHCPGLAIDFQVGRAVAHQAATQVGAVDVQRTQPAGVTNVRVHDQRHTATCLMLDAGADLKAASEALGHSDPRITMKVYRHVRADQRAQALTLLAGSLAPVELAQAASE